MVILILPTPQDITPTQFPAHPACTAVVVIAVVVVVVIVVFVVVVVVSMFNGSAVLTKPTPAPAVSCPAAVPSRPQTRLVLHCRWPRE